MDLALIRTVQGDQGTFGRWVLGGRTWPSLELPWRDNKPYVSCIPADQYLCELTYSKTFKRLLYIITNPPKGRSGLRVHGANWAGDIIKGYYSQLLGCMAPGLRYAQMVPDDGEKDWKPQWAVTSSKKALSQMMKLLNGEPFTLTITEAFCNKPYEWAFAPAA